MSNHSIEEIAQVAKTLNGQSVYVETVMHKAYVGHLRIDGHKLVIGHKEDVVDVSIVKSIRRV